jgi:Family of unknown function (DUF5681)
MPKAASLRNLRPWKPGQSGNPNGRPRAPRFTERDQHAILAVLAGALGDGARRASIKAMQAVLTNARTVLEAMELLARLERLAQASSAERLMTAPQVQVIQTRSPSAPPGPTPRRCRCRPRLS